MRLLLSILGLVVVALIFLFFAATEYLDWHGRMEVIEKRHPRVWRIINDRLFRLVMLFFIFSLLIENARETLKEIETEPFVINLAAVPTADPGAKNAQIAALKKQIDKLTPKAVQVLPLRCTVQDLAAELIDFDREWTAATPGVVACVGMPAPMPGMESAQDIQMRALMNERKLKAKYLSHDYFGRIQAVVDELYKSGKDTKKVTGLMSIIYAGHDVGPGMVTLIASELTAQASQLPPSKCDAKQP